MIDGGISLADSQRLEEWIRDHPDDREILDDLKKVYALIGQTKKKSVPDIPLHAADIVLLSQHRKRWMRWTLPAAACFLLFLAASTQGVLVQVGTIRVTIGTVSAMPNERESLAQGEKLSKRQDNLESSLQQLTLLQKETAIQNQEEMKRFTSELIRELNRCFNDTRSIAYLNPDAESAQSTESAQ